MSDELTAAKMRGIYPRYKISERDFLLFAYKHWPALIAAVERLAELARLLPEEKLERMARLAACIVDGQPWQRIRELLHGKARGA